MKNTLLKDICTNTDISWIIEKDSIQHDKLDNENFNNIIIILSGSANFHYNSSNDFISQGDILFIPQKNIYKIDPVSSSHNLKYIIISFNEEVLKQASSFLLISSPSDLNNKIKINDAKLTSLYEEFVAINMSLSTEQAVCSAKLFLLRLLKELRTCSYKSNYNMPYWLCTMIRQLNDFENIRDGVSKIYELSPYSKQYTIKKFKEYLNVLPTDYINQKRIEHASILLSNTDMDIISISLECGYDTIENFYKNFKHIKGMPPAKYRKMYCIK